MKIMFKVYCSGNEKIGLGHIRRSVNLANLIKENRPEHQIEFYGEYSEFALSFLKENRLTSFSSTLNEFINNSKFNSDSFYFIDSYNFQASHAAILNKNNVKWGAFDDFNEHTFTGSKFVINFRIGINCKYDSSLSLIGPKYMPVDQKLEKSKLNRKKIEIQNKILVCIGSSDLYQIGGKIVTTLSKRFQNFNWIIVSNGSHNFSSKDRILQFPITNSIYQLMQDAKFVICGGGGIKYEACYMEIPCLVFSQTEGEFEDSLILETKSLIVNGDLAEKFNSERLLKDFYHLIEIEANLRNNCSQIFSNNNLNIFNQISPLI